MQAFREMSCSVIKGVRLFESKGGGCLESYPGDSTRQLYFNLLCVDDLGDNGVKG